MTPITLSEQGSTGDFLKSFIKSMSVTTLFCLVIAFMTESIWSGGLLLHMAISFGYGFCSVISSYLIGWFWPQLSFLRICAVALSIAMVAGSINAYLWLQQFDGFGDFAGMRPVLFLGLIFTTITFYFFYAYEQTATAQKELATARQTQSEQEKTLLLSHLKQLQSQIEPHFLFNTLANISAMIDSNPTGARTMLERLTELLRGALAQNRKGSVRLTQELELIDAYLGIQAIRLGSRLQYTIVNNVQHDMTLPPMLLQPLVENAIKHGLEPQAAGGRIDVSVNETEQSLRIEVADTGTGFSQAGATSGQGVGLNNVRERLAMLFGDSASLSIVESEQTGVLATIQIASSALESFGKGNHEH